MIKAKNIRFDERTNALDYLEKCFFYLQNVENNPKDWKWVIICIHSALYGFAISACRGGNNESVISKTNKGFKKLITFDEALKRCQNPDWMNANISYIFFEFSVKQKESLRKLNRVRNNFEHFKPKTWLIEIHDFSAIINDCLDLTRLLVVYSDTNLRLKSYKFRKFKSLFYQSKKIINHSKLYQETVELIATDK